LVAAPHVDVFDVEGVDMARDKGQHREADVNEEVGAAAGDEKDTDRWHWEGISWGRYRRKGLGSVLKIVTRTRRKVLIILGDEEKWFLV